MATITGNGIQIKTLLEYRDRLKNDLLAIDPAWNLEPASPDGQKLDVDAELLANLDEQFVNAYSSVDPRTAVGKQLDRIAFLNGLDRQEATFSTATVTFTGQDGIDIPAGTEVRNEETDTLWATDQEVTVSGSTVDVGVTCQTAGPEPAGAGDLSIIATPVAGISSVTNADAAALGKARESDAELRSRRRVSVARLGRNQVGSLFGDVANVENVTNIRVMENVTGSTDSNGLLGHSFAVFVEGGDTVEVAEAIIANKAPGSSMNAGQFANQVQETVTTEDGATKTITFFRPIKTTIYIDVDLVGDFNSGIEDRIKEAIVAYSNAALHDAGTRGFDQLGFGIGDDVPVGKLFTPINKEVGDAGYVSQVQIGTDSSDITYSLLTMAFNELPVFEASAITVNVTF